VHGRVNTVPDSVPRKMTGRDARPTTVGGDFLQSSVTRASVPGDIPFQISPGRSEDAPRTPAFGGETAGTARPKVW
jgi:hypothetical protein